MPGGVGVLIGGRYRLSEPAGQSGTGRMWHARDEAIDREVAVNEVLLPSRPPAERAGLLAAAMSAARAVARLEHPAVIPVYDVVEQDNAPWIVTRLAAGPSLGAEIARHDRLPWRRAARVGEQVAGALAAAHDAGIVHGDLRPGTILLDEPSGDRAVVTDFGIARVLDAAPQLAAAGPHAGGLYYMAPEQLEDAEAGPPADLWSLGATLYHATEGRPPFAGSTKAAVMAAILTRRPAPPEHAGPLAGLIESLLSKDPDARPDARSALAALAAAALPPAAPAPARGPVPATRAATPAPPPASPAPRAAPASSQAVPASPRAAPPRRKPPLVTALAAAIRANPRLAVGVVTAVAMVLALILVTTLFPSSHRPASPGSPPASPGHSAPP